MKSNVLNEFRDPHDTRPEPEAVEIPLAAAVERRRRETGMTNSYEWYRRKTVRMVGAVTAGLP